jgi:hypothetical protein
MISTTQMTQIKEYIPIYISIDDRPKRGRGRQRGSKYSDEEKRQKPNDAALKRHNNNYEYYTLRRRLCKQRVRAAEHIGNRIIG